MAVIKHVVFDIGNVLFGYQPEHVIKQLLPDTLDNTLYLNYLFGADVWQQMDRGDLSLDEAYQVMVNACPDLQHRKAEIYTLVNGFPDHLIPIAETKALFLRCVDSHNVYILSNFQDKPFDRLLEAHPFLKKALGMVVSAKVNMMKPERGIYQYLLETYDLLPSDCLFIDDLDANIAAARKVGMHGIVYSSPDQLMKELEPYDLV